MRLFRFQILIELGVLAGIASAVTTVYITDLPVYKALAPCATQAVSSVVQGLTNSVCPALVTQLNTCACAQDSNSASINSVISTGVLYYCGSTAVDDAKSASGAFSAYCNQATPVTTPTPTAGAVSNYITDLSAFSDLGPCAGSALSQAVQSLATAAYGKCPSGASALESCACTKNQNSLAVSENINTQVSYSCGSTHTEDITSAQAVFAGYCGLGNGTSSFPTPTPLSGVVTYYITNLPIYSSLALCAQSAVSHPIQAQTGYNGDCPSDPRALVSCICVKDGNLIAASSGIKYSVSQNCGSTESSIITSALSVLDYYCSAGQGQVKPVGVTASVTTTSHGGLITNPTANGGTGANTATPTSIFGGGTTNTNSGLTKASFPVAAIGGIAAGAVVFIVLMLISAYRYRRRTQNNAPRQRPPFNPPPPSDFSPKPELDSTAVKKPSFWRKPVGTGVTSPVSPVNTPELSSTNNPKPFEVQGSAVQPTELDAKKGRGSGPWYEMHVP